VEERPERIGEDTKMKEPEIQDSSEESELQDRYNKRVDDLVARGGYSPRKARRYLDSIAKKEVKKFLKKRGK
jgi:polyhydroxyalkanoate synthesis regulator phasin